MAQKKRRKRKSKKRDVSREKKRRESTRQSLLSDSLIKQLNQELRFLSLRHKDEDYLRDHDFIRDRYEKYRRYDPVRYAKRKVVSSVKPTFLYAFQDVRDYLNNRIDRICRRRKERRESLFARRNIGVGHKVNQLKNYTIDSLLDCKRR